MRTCVLIACAVAACAVGGYAYAATTGSDSSTGACAKTAGGRLRLDTGGGCLPRARGSRTASGRTSAGTRP